MTKLRDLASFEEPVEPGTQGEVILQRFQSSPHLQAIPVVDLNGNPLGLIERSAFLVRMSAQYGHALWSKRPISDWLPASPMIADCEMTIDEFCGDILTERGADLMHGCLVSCEGKYGGVVHMVGLLQATASSAAERASEMTLLAEAADRSRETAEAALAAKSQFLGVMSHEIRTPLNGVLSVAEIVLRKSNQPDLEPFLRTIIESGGVLLRLLNDALDLTRAEASGLQLEEAPLQVARIVDDVRGLWSAQAELKGIELGCLYEGPQDICIQGDAVRLRQIVNNMTGNALKFTTEGRVDVLIRARDDRQGVSLTIEVADTGPGIPPERLDCIFEPFQQTDAGVRMGGAGLGLAVCRQLAINMNGSIHAENRDQGGAVFRFEAAFPRVAAEASQGSETADETIDSDRPISVLVVDDNPTNRMVATTLCEMYGCRTATAENGAEAVEMARTDQYDLILMDIMMPVMDGTEATRRIRSGGGPASRVPILALTANADLADAAFYRHCGVNGVVEKPIRPEQLLAAMNAVLQIDPDAPAPGQDEIERLSA